MLCSFISLFWLILELNDDCAEIEDDVVGIEWEWWDGVGGLWIGNRIVRIGHEMMGKRSSLMTFSDTSNDKFLPITKRPPSAEFILSLSKDSG